MINNSNHSERFGRLAVLFAGEAPNPDSSTAILARALHRYNIGACFEATSGRGRSWWRAALSSDAMILVIYDDPGLRETIKLTTIALSGRPLIRWWVGSDVLNCSSCAEASQFATYLGKFTAANVAVAPHLVEELAQVGLEAICIPSILDPQKYDGQRQPSGQPAKRILAYLPTFKSSFYGEEVVRRSIETNPDMEFLIVGNTCPERFSQYANVRNLGWVQDMQAVYSQAGCLLRVTEHDGLPLMVLESLLQAKYVIYSWPFEGCWLARDGPQVQAAIQRFRLAKEPNRAGMESVRRFLNPDPAQRFADLIRRVTQDERSRLRWWRVLRSAPPYLAPLFFESFKRKLGAMLLPTKSDSRTPAELLPAAAGDSIEAPGKPSPNFARRA